MVGSNVELDGSVSRPYRLTVNECVCLLGLNRYLESPRLRILCKHRDAKHEDSCKDAGNGSQRSLSHGIRPPARQWSTIINGPNPIANGLTATLTKITDVRMQTGGKPNPHFRLVSYFLPIRDGVPVPGVRICKGSAREENDRHCPGASAERGL